MATATATATAAAEAAPDKRQATPPASRPASWPMVMDGRTRRHKPTSNARSYARVTLTRRRRRSSSAHHQLGSSHHRRGQKQSRRRCYWSRPLQNTPVPRGEKMQACIRKRAGKER